MIIEAKNIENGIDPKHEVKLQCGHCGMEVDDIEYKSGTCTDCGEPWDEIRHVSIYATSIPMTGQTV